MPLPSDPADGSAAEIPPAEAPPADGGPDRCTSAPPILEQTAEALFAYGTASPEVSRFFAANEDIRLHEGYAEFYANHVGQHADLPPPLESSGVGLAFPNAAGTPQKPDGPPGDNGIWGPPDLARQMAAVSMDEPAQDDNYILNDRHMESLIGSTIFQNTPPRSSSAGTLAGLPDSSLRGFPGYDNTPSYPAAGAAGAGAPPGGAPSGSLLYRDVGAAQAGGSGMFGGFGEFRPSATMPPGPAQGGSTLGSQPIYSQSGAAPAQPSMFGFGHGQQETPAQAQDQPPLSHTQQQRFSQGMDFPSPQPKRGPLATVYQQSVTGPSPASPASAAALAASSFQSNAMAAGGFAAFMSPQRTPSPPGSAGVYQHPHHHQQQQGPATPQGALSARERGPFGGMGPPIGSGRDNSDRDLSGRSGRDDSWRNNSSRGGSSHSAAGGGGGSGPIAQRSAPVTPQRSPYHSPYHSPDPSPRSPRRQRTPRGSRGGKDKDGSNRDSNKGSDKSSGRRERNRAPFLSANGGVKYTTLEQAVGNIYAMCKDQHGCRFLQKRIEEGQDKAVAVVFPEVLEHVVELGQDGFGNYAVQKVAEFATPEQRLQLIQKLAPELVNIALNMHGTRAVQKLIDLSTLPPAVEHIIKALDGSVVKLIKDLNGNHCIQRCLQRLDPQYNQFIYDSVAKACVEVSTHRHGCCVMQRCIDYAVGPQKMQLIQEITSNALELAVDAYSNYVLQYVLDLQLPMVNRNICRKFEGHLYALSMQKFSSNVVEKCLRVGEPDSKSKMIRELVESKKMSELLTGAFSNYTIQACLAVASREDFVYLADAIRPHLPSLKHTPYGKRIASKIKDSPHQR